MKEAPSEGSALQSLLLVSLQALTMGLTGTPTWSGTQESCPLPITQGL